MVFMEIQDPGVENNVRYSHEGGPGRTSAFLGAQWVLVHDSVNGKNENRPCDISSSPIAQHADRLFETRCIEG